MPSLPDRMRASVKIRGDGQKPLFRVKAPIKILGFPLFTGFSMGEKEDISLLLGTALQIGPSVRIAFRPNDENSLSALPLSLSSPLASSPSSSIVIKAGLGPWFSPNNCFLSVSAEIDLKSDKNTKIMLKTNPRFGDFSLRRLAADRDVEERKREREREREEKKTVASKVEFINKISSKQGSAVNGVNGVNGYPVENGHVASPVHNHEPGSPVTTGDSAEPVSFMGKEVSSVSEKKIAPKKTTFADIIQGKDKNTFWGPKPKEGIWALQVHSDLPIGFWGNLTCRWGLTLPKDAFSGGFNRAELLSFSVLPSLALDKITLETGRRRGGVLRRGRAADPRKDIAKLSDDVITLHAENYTLKKQMEDVRREVLKNGKRNGKFPEATVTHFPEMYGHEENLLRSQIFDEIVQDKSGSKKSKKFDFGKESKVESVKEKEAGKDKKESNAGWKKQEKVEKGEKEGERKKGGDTEKWANAEKDVGKELQMAIMSTQKVN